MEFVSIPACQPVSEIAGYPFLFNSMLSFDALICSPVESNTSISLSFGTADNSQASLISVSVVFPCADTTTTIFFASFFNSMILSATIFSFILSATELPPNFNTIVFILSQPLFFRKHDLIIKNVGFLLRLYYIYYYVSRKFM